MRSALAPIAAAVLFLQTGALPALSASRAPADTVVPASLPARVVDAALAHRGSPYVRGGTTSLGMDCSGLVYRVFEEAAGIAVPRSVVALFRAGSPAMQPLHVADLLFFDTVDSEMPGRPTHVGVYAGDEKFVHSISEGSPSGVTVSSLSEPYYRQRFIGARRLVAWRTDLSITLADSPRAIVLDGPFASRERLKILVSSRMTGGGPVELVLTRDGTEILVARIAPSSRRPSEVDIVPDQGDWVVRITRLFRGRELGRVTFRVEE